MGDRIGPFDSHYQEIHQRHTKDVKIIDYWMEQSPILMTPDVRGPICYIGTIHPGAQTNITTTSGMTILSIIIFLTGRVCVLVATRSAAWFLMGH